MVKRVKYVPVTPAGSPLVHLEAKTEDRAWENLMREAAHMPYKDKAAFERRGYTVEEWRGAWLGQKENDVTGR